jgi:EAL domain-containing protein (putative c-di-GMP-specific phosphodiesterase class I)
MVSMLTELGMTVIVQGVESQAQNDLLCELGCENMQGFYFAKPLAQDDIMELIRNKNTSL